MIEVQTVYPAKLDGIYELIREQGHWIFPQRRDLFFRLFEYSWRKDDWLLGFALMVDGKPEGFLGTIFSERSVCRRTVKIGNLTTWVVNPKYRSQSLLLLNALMNTDADGFTDMTASSIVSKILIKMYGFHAVDSHYRILHPLSGWRNLFGSGHFRITLNSKHIMEMVSLEQQTILHNHLPYGCGVLLVHADDQRQCLVLFQKAVMRRVPFAQILHISDKTIFFQCLNRIILNIVSYKKQPIVLINERLLGGFGDNVGFRLRRPSRILFKNFQAEDIDDLYNECIPLNLPV